ncbi:MAG TPA: HemK/PrmC family methyltransferase [Actinomycetota bacterium]
MSEPTTTQELIDVGHRVLADSTHIFEDHDNKQEARDLLAHCLGVDEADLDDGVEPPRRTRERYLSMVTRRAAGEPFPFLVGSIEFYGLELKVKPGPFVPRPSSELTVEWAVKRLRRRRDPVAVDVCTGAGPIALGIAHEVESAQVWGLDIDRSGLAQARSNAKRLGIDNVRFAAGDLYDALPRSLSGGVDVITGHVPYVPVDELDDLPTEVRGFEPVHTLTDHSGDGLDLMRRAVGEAPEWLKPGGWLLLELSEDIADDIESMCVDAGFEDVGTISDDDKLSVVVEGRKSRGTKSRSR